MVEMHLLAVNVDFRYDPFYALGVVTSFDRFMQGYRPEQDKSSIFDGLCRALEDDPQRYRHDADRLRQLAARCSSSELLSWLQQSNSLPEFADLQEKLQLILENPKFKYSRLFAIGLFTLFELAEPELLKDEVKRTEMLKQVCAALRLPEEKLQKDLELYRSNLDKMTQAQSVMEDLLKADRKKREEREQARAAAAKATDSPEATPGA